MFIIMKTYCFSTIVSCAFVLQEYVFKNHQNEKPKKDNNFPFIDQIKVLRVPL